MTTQEQKLSLPAAVLINVNIMIGAGIFINTSQLAQRCGGLGFLCYAIVAIMLLPLVLCIAKLVEMYPIGGFYTYAQREISPFVGFVSGWSYFTGKLASASLLIHTSMLIMQSLIPTLALVPTLCLDVAILGFFIALNMLNMRSGSNIQIAFIILKAMPVLFVFLSGLFLIQGDSFSTQNLAWSGIPMALPLVVYAIMGFEAACSISSKIKDPEKNAPLAILISYAIVTCIMISYQLIFYGIVGDALANYGSYRDAFPNLMHIILPSNLALAHKIGGLFNVAIACSALGAVYGMLFSNTWNLYTLAQNKHVPFAHVFTALNKNFIPYACILTEGVIGLFYLYISQGDQVPLQQVSALSVVSTYTLSIFALIYAKKRNPALRINRWIPVLGLINCLILIGACVRGLVLVGIGSLYGFFVLLAIGTAMFFTTPGKTISTGGAN